jgi:hypothetical protein
MIISPIAPSSHESSHPIRLQPPWFSLSSPGERNRPSLPNLADRITSTAVSKALDGGVILDDPALLAQKDGNKVITPTSNIGHLAQLIEVADWQVI